MAEYIESADFDCCLCGKATHIEKARIFESEAAEYAKSVARRWLLEICEDCDAQYERENAALPGEGVVLPPQGVTGH